MTRGRQSARFSSRSLIGILNLDKPLGLTSYDVVSVVRRLSGQRRVGHAGTLDPLATGVLVVCLGKATRVTEHLMSWRKVYRVCVRLGISTTTDDAEGEILSEVPVDVSRAEVEAALQQFVGQISQVPPLYSALKRNGRRLYELAREGTHVEVPPRQVDVYGLRIVDWASPLLGLDVECGQGTYVRALARDLGNALGCGAHVVSLRRLRVGLFTVQEALALQELEQVFSSGTIGRHLHPLDTAFHDLPAAQVSAEGARQLAMGQRVAEVEGPSTAVHEARAYDPGGTFVALIARDGESGAWRPRKVFVRPEDI